MAMNVKFLKGLLANLPSTRDEGTLYFVTDEGRLYLGSNLIADVTKLDTAQVQEILGNALTNYYTNSKIDELLKEITDAQAEVNAAQAEKDAAQDKALNDYKAEMVETLKGYQTTIPAETYDAFGSAAAAEESAKSYTDKAIDDLVKAYLDGETDDVINTLEEVAAWINNDTAGVTKIIEDVATNAANIKTINESAVMTSGITAAKVGEYDAVKSTVDANKSTWDSVTSKLDASTYNTFVGSTYATLDAAVAAANAHADSKDADIAKGVEAQSWGNHANAGYAKSADIAGSLEKAESAVQPAALEVYAKSADIAGSLAKAESALQAADLADYAKTADVNSAISTATTDMATNASVDSKLEAYAKSADVNVELAKKVDNSTYNAYVDAHKNDYDNDAIDSAISTATADMATNASVDGKLANYVTSEVYGAHLTAQSEADAAQDAEIAKKADKATYEAYVEANDAKVEALEAKFAGTNVTMADVVKAVNMLADGAETTDGAIRNAESNINEIVAQLTWGSF